MDQRPPLIPGHEAILDRLIGLTHCAGPIDTQTDKYFTNTSRIVGLAGDAQVTFAVFMRRRVVAALEPAIRLVRHFVPDVKITRFYQEGDIVPSESKIMEITGSMQKLSEIETLLLQKIGFPCVSANNAYEMCRALPKAGFMDMHARHGSGAEMNILAAYGAAVGSAAARRADPTVKGFVGSSQDLTAPFFGAASGMGTMPHALVGYTGGDVLRAMQLFAEKIPEARNLTALVDYTGHEVTDSIRCARWFYDEAKLDAQGKSFGVGSTPMADASPRVSTTRNRWKRSASGWAPTANTTSWSRCWGAGRSSSIPTTSSSTRCAASCSARASRRLPSSMCGGRWMRRAIPQPPSSVPPASIRRSARSWRRRRRRWTLSEPVAFYPPP